MKKFILLQGVIPISIAAVANETVFVCAALFHSARFIEKTMHSSTS